MQDLIDDILRFRDERNWKQFHMPKDAALSLMLEAGEVLELFQWKPADFNPAPEDLGRELADVLYWTLLMAHDAGIDMRDAFARKMAENRAKYPVELARSSSAKYTEL